MEAGDSVLIIEPNVPNKIPIPTINKLLDGLVWDIIFSRLDLW